MAINNKNDVDGDGLGFDPISFARGIFDAIEPNRSQMGPNINEVVTTPSSEGAVGSKAESRMNTFLRLLGFPATRNESLLNKANTEEEAAFLKRSRKENILSQDGTLNYIANILSVDSVDTISALSTRNRIATAPVSGEQFNKLLERPLDFNAGITGDRRRAQLFPLIVDASIPIYPLSKRVAPFFNNGDYQVGGQARLSRPFIEHIIYIRAKELSGFNDSQIVKDLKQGIEDVLPSDQSIENVLSNPNPTAIELFIVQKFLQALKRLVIDYQKAISDANRAIAEVRFLPTFVAYPEERSNVDIQSGGDVAGFALDEKIQELERILREKEAMIFLLPTEFINRSDQARRADSELAIHNFKEDIFISNFTDLLTYEAESVREDLKKAKGERQRKVQIIEKAKRDLMYFTGEFTGLSIFDVICILYALFTVDLRFIVSLLNKDALVRFVLDPFFSTQSDIGTIRTFKSLSDILAGGTTLNTAEAISEVQKKVSEAFAIAELYQTDLKAQRQRG